MEKMFITPPPILADMSQPFFDFEFKVIEGQVIEARYKGAKISAELGESIYTIKQKYDEKNNRLKKRTKIFNEKQKHYCQSLEAWQEKQKHLQDHIRKAEAKLTEYKNTILAFGVLASKSLSK